jgi:hypothetical protein
MAVDSENETNLAAMITNIRLPRLSAVLLLYAAALFAVQTRAMTIFRFDHMAVDDQDEYVADLVVGAQNVLKQSGHSDLAQQVHTLFTKIKAGDRISDGMAEFEVLLAKGRLADAKRMEKDPNARPLEVEDVLALTLKKNGIEVPDSFFTVNVNFKPKRPAKPIGILDAAEANHIDEAKRLLANGADANAKNDKGVTPLDYAAANNARAMAEVLLAHGAQVNAKASDGWTALHVAANNNAIDVVEVLVSKGAQVNAKNNAGETALTIALRLHKDAIADFLRSHGATQ